MPLDKPLPGLLDGRLVEVAEVAAERDEILVGQRLTADEQHVIVEPRAMDRRKGPGVDSAQIDTLHLRPQCGARRLYTHLQSLPLALYGPSATFNVGSIPIAQNAPASSSPAEMNSGSS